MILMENKKKTIRYLFSTFFLLLSGVVLLISCKDDYYYDDKEPDWLGASIYDYLKEDGSFNYVVRIIDDVGYAEVLKQTGSKTLFAAKDSAFETFFRTNQYGIRQYSDLTLAQRRAILFSGMLDDTYLVEMMSSTAGTPPVRGEAMRRTTSWLVGDSIPFEKGDYLPKNTYWSRFVENGLYVLNDDSDWTMVHLMEPFLKSKSITDSDFEYIIGKTRSADDAFIFDAKIIQKDITCKNGYVNVLEKVVFPPSNMAQYVRTNPDTKTFNRFLERYCAPYFYRMNGGDSVFVKRFFTDAISFDPNSRAVEGVLNFDPGENSYSVGTSMQSDMAAMFVPTDEALEEYFSNGEGKFLKERYGSWDNMPNNVLNLLINNHMRVSFVASVPSRFSSLEDKIGTSMGISPSDIKYSQLCSNGVTYIMNKVYAPTEYASVMAPVIIGENTKVFKWAIENLKFDLYLLSMDNQFSLMVPTDEQLNTYINPVSENAPIRERWKFWYDSRRASVYATVYNAVTGDSLRVMPATNTTVRNALRDILDNHIIVGDIESGKSFYQTKGGATLKISTDGAGLHVQGGGNIERLNTPVVDNTFPMRNGKTYMMDQMIHASHRSVYSIMSSEVQFREFFNLCMGDTMATTPIFIRDGIDFRVSFFNTFNYTVYIPTNEAVRQAINSGVIKEWDEINAIEAVEEREVEAQKLRDFIRYHFQDNSVYISGEPISRTYETASLNTSTNKFRRLQVTGNGSDLSLIPINGNVVHVVKGGGLYNLMVRDYVFGAGSVETSSYAVIHQINAVLNFE